MINAAIIGLGHWGRHLVDSVQGESGLIRFTTGATRTPANAAAYAAGKGITLQNSYEDVLADLAVDAIVLATPHTLHAAQVMAAAKASKHVFTEKPLALDRRNAAGAIRTCARAGVTLAVGYNWRFQPALQEIRRMLADGRLGRLLHLEGNFCGPSAYRFPKDHWRQLREEGPAGGMTGRGVHMLDAYLYLAGRIASVYAQSERLALNYGLDDTTSILLRFANGATGYLGTIIATAETWRMQVFGSKGWAEVGGIQHLNTWQMRVSYIDPHSPLARHEPEVVAFPEVSTERAELEDFARAVVDKRPLAAPGGDEEHGAAVLETISKSAGSGRAVRVPGTAKK